MTLKADDIVILIEMFAASDWNELHVEIEGIQFFLSTDPHARLASGTGAAQVPVAVYAAQPATATPAFSVLPSALADVAESGVPADWVAVKAPNLGTFYRSPKPGAAPFVGLGQSIEADSEICLLEVMKLFTAVKAGTTGIVRQICVADGELVEGDQILFYIEPA